MSPLKKLGIACASYILLGWFVCQPLTELGIYKPYFKMSKNGHEISISELDSFLNIWSKLMQSRFAGNFNKKSLNMKSGYPKNLKKWLELQYWDIERFFYDEQRIRDLLEYVDARLQLEENKEISRKSGKINLHGIIKNLEQRLEASSFNEKELDLIEANRYQIAEILSGRAVLGEEKQ